LATVQSQSTLYLVGDGAAYCRVSFDDVTFMASAIEIQNDTPMRCLYSVYNVANQQTPLTTYEATAGQLRIWNLPGGQRFDMTQFSISMRLL
jgi:hypothetical protein